MCDEVELVLVIVVVYCVAYKRSFDNVDSSSVENRGDWILAVDKVKTITNSLGCSSAIRKPLFI